MKMKRIMSLGLAFALSLSLAACGSKEDPKPSTAPGGESDPPVVESQGGEDKAPLKVLLVSALEGDKAFADSAIAGARKAEKDFKSPLKNPSFLTTMKTRSSPVPRRALTWWSPPPPSGATPSPPTAPSIPM